MSSSSTNAPASSSRIDEHCSSSRRMSPDSYLLSSLNLRLASLLPDSDKEIWRFYRIEPRPDALERALGDVRDDVVYGFAALALQMLQMKRSPHHPSPNLVTPESLRNLIFCDWAQEEAKTFLDGLPGGPEKMSIRDVSMALEAVDHMTRMNKTVRFSSWPAEPRDKQQWTLIKHVVYFVLRFVLHPLRHEVKLGRSELLDVVMGLLGLHIHLRDHRDSVVGSRGPAEGGAGRNWGIASFASAEEKKLTIDTAMDVVDHARKESRKKTSGKDSDGSEVSISDSRLKAYVCWFEKFFESIGIADEKRWRQSSSFHDPTIEKFLESFSDKSQSGGSIIVL
ncbi:hypothetical protein G7054_g11058 [Neopestalotiopsis clavispora]|nr:hypothetical protein G7054_g11058 [Neopestalotiopsis clavispora]